MVEIHCRTGTESKIIETRENETVVSAIVRHFKIPRKVLKLVVKGKKVDEAEADELHKQNPTAVFFVVGQPLTDEEIAQRKARKEARLQEMEERRLKEEAEKDRKAALAAEHAAWVEEEARRLANEEELFKKKEATRRQKVSCCASLSGAIMGVAMTVVSAPGPILNGIGVFFRSIFDPPPAVETEEVLKVRQQDAEVTARERRMAALRSRPGKGANHTAMMGG